MSKWSHGLFMFDKDCTCLIRMLRQRVLRITRVKHSRWDLKYPDFGQRGFQATKNISPLHTKQFWTTGRALLLSCFASSLVYVHGATDAGTRLEGLWTSKILQEPMYGSTKDLCNVS